MDKNQFFMKYDLKYGRMIGKANRVLTEIQNNNINIVGVQIFKDFVDFIKTNYDSSKLKKYNKYSNLSKAILYEMFDDIDMIYELILPIDANYSIISTHDDSINNINRTFRTLGLNYSNTSYKTTYLNDVNGRQYSSFKSQIKSLLNTINNDNNNNNGKDFFKILSNVPYYKNFMKVFINRNNNGKKNFIQLLKSIVSMGSINNNKNNVFAVYISLVKLFYRYLNSHGASLISYNDETNIRTPTKYKNVNNTGKQFKYDKPGTFITLLYSMLPTYNFYIDLKKKKDKQIERKKMIKSSGKKDLKRNKIQVPKTVKLNMKNFPKLGKNVIKVNNTKKPNTKKL